MSGPVLERIIRRWPDSIAEQQLLSAISRDRTMACDLADELSRRNDLSGEPLGALFPGLEYLPGAQPTNLTTRCRNVLGREQIRSWSELARLTTARIRAFQSFGAGSFQDLLACVITDWAAGLSGGAIDRALALAESVPAIEDTGGRGAGTEQKAPPPDASFDPFVEGILEALRWTWREQGARTLREAIALWTRSQPPADLATLVDAALALDLAPMIGVERPSEAAWSALLDFDPRALEVLAHRRLLPTKMTLDELGLRFGVTRERIRQVEVKSVERLRQRWERERRCVPLHHLAAATARVIGATATPTGVLLALDDAVARSSDSGKPDALRRGVLAFFMDPRAEIDGLSMTDAAAKVLRDGRRHVDDLATGSIVPRDWFEKLVESLDAPDVLKPIILEHLGLRPLGGGYVPWRGSVNEKAVAVLTIHGSTMTAMELHEVIGLEVSPRYLANALQAESRIMRRGRDRYGLRSWGGEEYSGIAEELEQAIERSSDGRIVLDDVIPLFVEEFGVSEASVRHYANDWRFYREAGGGLRMRGAADPDPSFRYQSPEDTAAVYRLGGLWHLRIVVDGEVLRGSGRMTRNGVAILVGLEPGLALGFEYEGGTVTFSWRSQQPTIGSVRGIATAHGCAEGDLLFIPLEGDEPRASRVTRAVQLARAAGLRRLALETGLGEAEDLEGDGPASLSAALGLPPGADWQDIGDRLRDRGDAHLLDFLPGQWR